MPVTISATQLRRQLGDIIRQAHVGKKHFIIEKDGLPIAALIPIADYEELMRVREQQAKRQQETESS